MAASNNKITKTVIDNLTPGRTIWDNSVKGFGIRCQVNAKVFILKAFINGKQRFVTIGRFGSPWTVEQAKKEAQRLLVELRQGADPTQAKRNIRNAAAITVAYLCERYLREYAWPHKPKSAGQDESNIQNHIVPLIGNISVAHLNRNDIENLQRKIEIGATKPKNPKLVQLAQRGGSVIRGGKGVSNRCLALMSKMLNLAEEWGLRPQNSNPVQRIKRFPENKRERYLSDKEFKRLAIAMDELSETESPYSLAAIRLLIITGARLGEILNAKWSQYDADKAVLRLSDSKSGQKIIRLSSPALEILNNLPKMQGNELIIAGRVPNHPMVGVKKAWRRIRKQARLSDVRIHDLRHTFASVAVSNGIPIPVIGALLGHSRITTTERYAHLSADTVIASNDNIGLYLNKLLSQK